MVNCHLPLYLAFALLAVLFAGCGKRARQAEVSYDLVSSELMLDIGNALLENPEQAAEITGNLRAEELARADWGDEARKLSRLNEEYHRRYKLFAEAEELLAQGRLNELAQRIDQAEQQGESSIELLTLRELPMALQALELYCRRMPFNCSEDVEYALNALKPYRAVLDRSDAFGDFLKEQYALESELRTKERLADVAVKMVQLDAAICCGKNEQVARLLNELKSDYPEAPLLKWLEKEKNGSWVPSKALRTAAAAGTCPISAEASAAEWSALEIAMALGRGKLEGVEEHGFLRMVDALKKKTTITGTALKAACLKNVSCFEEAIKRWNAERTRVPGLFDGVPIFFGDYLRLCGVHHRIRKGTSPVDVIASLETLLVWCEAK